MQNMGAESSVENRAKQTVLVQRNWQTEKVEERALRFMMHTHLQQVEIVVVFSSLSEHAYDTLHSRKRQRDEACF